jgi:hypothetical protein
VRLYFGGGEIGGHRTLLAEEGVRNVSMSYMGLRRRVKFSRPWLIKDKFDSHTSVFLDSGTYTINGSTDVESDEIEEIWEHYQDFVNANLDRVDLVSEFDAITMGLDWIEEQRETYWASVPTEKFMAMWHPTWGVHYLNEMASRYEVIGIPATVLEGRNLTPVLNAIAAKGVRIHGVAMTKIEEMQSIRWDSVASTSWISPSRFGDTIVWTGNQLKRYPKKMKDTARKRHRSLFTQMGLNAAAIANDDPQEVLRLSIRSWLSFEEYVNRHHKSGNVVTPLFSEGPPQEVETEENGVDNQASEPVQEVTTPKKSGEIVKRREPSTILPVMGMGKADEEDEESPQILNVRSDSARVCNTCFLSEKCPMYEPDSNCVYNIPVVIRTREQIRALRQGMLEMQTQRVMFMRFAEEVEGGYADPNLTKEVNLLTKMISEYEEAEREGFSLRIEARGQGPQGAQAGMISRIFGDRAGQQVQEIEGGPVPVESIVDAEWTDGGEGGE